MGYDADESFDVDIYYFDEAERCLEKSGWESQIKNQKKLAWKFLISLTTVFLLK